MSIYKSRTAAALVALLLTGPALAKTTPEQAAELGGDRLTPVGAERAGNADGTIPPWTGGIKEFPEDYKVGERLVDPYEDDDELFTITAENVDQYADKLSPGQIAMFERYPDSYEMPVYPTRRSAFLPDSEYALIKEWPRKPIWCRVATGWWTFAPAPHSPFRRAAWK